jgi:hypothetical protein
MNGSRIIAGIAVAILGLWFLVSVFLPDAPEAGPARSFTSSRQCQECHPEPYAEWEASQHAIAWTNPQVRFLSNDFAIKDCIACHAPRPVFVVGVAERVLPRENRRREGVDCITCHQLPDGGMAGTISDPRAACQPTERIELTRPEFCAGCHNQHKTVDQWRDSEWPARGKDCLSCHMPHRNGDPNAGRDHRFLAGHDLPTLVSAVELRGRRKGEGEGWVVELENNGAGHAFPTDQRSRAADLFWRPLPADGAAPESWRHLHRIRDPYRTETDIPSTLLHSGETRSFTIPDAPAGGAIEVALFYKGSPYWDDPQGPDPDREATLLHRIILRP